MRLWSASRRTNIVLATALLGCSVAVVSESSAASAAVGLNGRHSSCVSVRGVLEQTVKYDTVGSDIAGTPPMQKVGDTAVYTDTIFGSDGSVVGKALGYVTIVAIRPSDGHLLTDYHETVQLPQGTLSDSAKRLDRDGMIAGEWLNFSATGTSGDFAGKVGYRRWRLLPPLSNPPVPSEKAQVEITLCG
ncbi:hypothetical protein OG900_03700 [Streptomyces sp. NBC_00433]